MTWNQLSQFIDRICPSERDAQVKFIEPYDKERAGFCVDADFATRDRRLAVVRILRQYSFAPVSHSYIVRNALSPMGSSY